MPFVELFAPKGALDGERGRRVKERLVAEVMQAEGAPDNEAAREISWLVVNEPQEWFVGGRPIAGEEQPRYVVRVSVPAGSLDDDKRADMIQRITRVLSEGEEDPARLHDKPVAWVHLIEIADGNWGAMGKIFRFPDIIEYVIGAPVPG